MFNKNKIKKYKEGVDTLIDLFNQQIHYRGESITNGNAYESVSNETAATVKIIDLLYKMKFY